jgi:D-glycero-alpha-D-manno-heptose-7-phosphate kinase
VTAADNHPSPSGHPTPPSGTISPDRSGVLDATDATTRLRRGPVILVHASAPTRTADIGGWTDTWFARTGLVCNIALDHRAEVRVAAQPGGDRTVRLVLRLTGEDYEFEPHEPPGRHPIIEHAIVAPEMRGSVEVDIAATTLAGSGLGTSASVMVALVAALSAAIGDPQDAGELAAMAHSHETHTGKQSGVQDHAAAAWGGISLLDVRYPMIRREAVEVPPAAFAELGARLHTVYFGEPHASSELHDEVIERLDAGHGEAELDRMRGAADLAARSLRSGDLTEFGVSLRIAHEAIGSMHAGLVGPSAHELEQLARVHGARGWKVNGAGGDGGSMVVLGPADAEADAAFVAALRARSGWQLVEAAVGVRGVTTELAVAEVRREP